MTLRLLICFSWLLAAIVPVPAASVSGTVTPATVIWLSPQNKSVVEPVAGQHARMVQKSKHFEPHLLAVAVGTLVDFPNLDPIFHNAFSNFDGQLFDIGLYPPGSSRSVRFHREGLVRIFCNIHPSMSAVIVVLATPYFTITDKKGGFAILNVPPGQYKLHFFHERATTETLDALTRTVTILDKVNELGKTAISDAGYIPAPHKNKYGRDYPPDAPGMYH